MTTEYSPSEVAHRLGTSTRTIQRWIADGRLPARRVGGRWRVASDAFVASGLADEPAVPPIRSVFVANRGEIATRIARTCERLGIEVVAPATDGPAAIDLLDIDAVIAAAERAGAEALHPGFGFLAENAVFAQAVIDAGIRWVGPPPTAIQTMGDKAAARRLATDLGIPVPAGYDGPDQSDTSFEQAAERIGYPLLIKPAAGGGGKGMRTVREPARLAGELAAARREAASAFGDDRLILEQLVEGARHVEIQVLFDGAGRGVHLGERDCSIQRRHQKVLEEAPSPAVDADLRARMGAAALRLASAVGYASAGTCEFLLDERGAFTFLEMNTRLQVEHPVTELITGRDLVEDQLRIAAGEPLGLAQDDVANSGHAVEVRLYAEDAEAGFLPAVGRIALLRWPTGDGVRVDAGVEAGDEVTGRFDPMLAKIIARGRDRDDALQRLAGALDDTLVLGLTTNLRFLRWLVRQPAVVDGLARTDTLDHIWPPDDWADRARVPDQAWRIAATVLADRGQRGPWSSGWRLNADPVVRLSAEASSRTIALAHAMDEPTPVHAVVGDTAFVDVEGCSVAFRLAPPPDVDRAAQAAARSHDGGPATLVAPMPGQVLLVHVVPGSPVEAGEPVVTLEAMKMEHAVTSPLAGVLSEVLVKPGDQVVSGQHVASVTVPIDGEQGSGPPRDA